MPPPGEPQVFTARPTFRLDGTEHERLAALVTSMVMTEQEGGLSSLELRLANSASISDGSAEYAFDAGGELDFGKELVVGAGDSLAPVEIFRGLVTGLEGVFSEDAPPELIVLAEDALQKLRCRRRTKTYDDQSLSDIVGAVARDHALTPTIDGLGENFGTQVQLNETDLGFLRRLLARVDADLQIVGTELHVSPRAQVRRGQLDLALGRELKSARVLSDLAHQVTRSTAKGWDVGSGQPLDGDGADNALGPGAGGKGSDAFRAAFSDRTQHSGQFYGFNQDEVDAVATTVRNRRARRFLRLQGVTTGTPAMRVGTHVEVSGISAWFNNTYYVTSVRHLFDLTEGYRTEFEAQCAFRGES